MLQRLRETLALALLSLLPFHAFLITVATRIVAGPNHAPLGALALWKEALLAIIVLLGLFECHRNLKAKSLKLDVDLLDISIGLFAIVALAVSFVTTLPLTAAVYGFRYDLLAPLTFLVLRRVPWSPTFVRSAGRTLCVAAVAACVLGLGVYVLPDSFYRALGYSDLHSLYVPGAPLAAFQQLGGSAIRRMQGPMSGPNQFGLWLLLPWSLALVGVLQKLTTGKKMKRSLGFALLLFTVGIVMSFSRSAWVAAAVIGALALWIYVPKSVRCTMAWIAAIFLSTVLTGVTVLFPQAILRSVSNRGHIEKPLLAIDRIVENPIGRGLGSAGPASNRLSDACVELPAGSDAAWAKDRPDLCVFVGGAQVQPVGRACSCPFLPENWYLQIGVEAGIVGMLLWIGVTGLMLWKLAAMSGVGSRVSGSIAPSVFFAFLGVSVAGLFLHSWEDAAVAMSVWLLAAAALSKTTHSLGEEPPAQ